MKINPHIPHSAPNRGFSLMEMIVYVAILSLFVGALAVTTTVLMSSFVEMRAKEEVAQASMIVIERLNREIRFAHGVVTGASTLDTSPGVLTLDTEDGAGNPSTVMFSLSADRVMIQQGSGAATPLTHAGITVSNLVFHHIVGATSEALRTSFTLTRTVHGNTIVKDFRTFTVLDGS